jgi:hypothetical protein
MDGILSILFAMCMGDAIVVEMMGYCGGSMEGITVV